VQPDDPALRELVFNYLRANPWQCGQFCVALDLGPGEGESRRVAIVQSGTYQVVQLAPGKAGVQVNDTAPAGNELTDQSKVEVREVPRRVIFIDGKPVGQPLLEASTAPLEASPPPR
jgi:hypothetical protein